MGSSGPQLLTPELRPPLEPSPNINSSIFRHVKFLHPACPDGKNVLFTWLGYDQGGIHYDTAHAACAVLADNSWNGFFTLTKHGNAAEVEQRGDHILTADQYYFQVPDKPLYTVLCDFKYFKLPELPPQWRILPGEQGTADQDRCQITGSQAAVGDTRIIGRRYRTWYNEAFRDSGASLGTAEKNNIVLRLDIRRHWYSKKFVIVPKMGKWVFHVLDHGRTDELLKRYHNVELQPLKGLSLEMLFARFAKTIISQGSHLTQEIPTNLAPYSHPGSSVNLDPGANHGWRNVLNKRQCPRDRRGGEEELSGNEEGASDNEDDPSDDELAFTDESENSETFNTRPMRKRTKSGDR